MTAPNGLVRFAEEYHRLGRDAEFFATARLFDGTPAVWPQELNYVQWRHDVATELDVDPISVQLVGSARLGYSMNPTKDYKDFSSDSDIDIAVVSPELFEIAWSELRAFLSGPALNVSKPYVRKLVFEECIGLDVVLPHLSFGSRWAAARDRFVRHLGPGFENCEVNYRVYRSHRALRTYQLTSIRTAIDRAIEDGILT